MSKRIPIIVLNDGETWCTLDGVEVLFVRPLQMRQLAEGHIDACDLKPEFSVSINDLIYHYPLPDMEDA